MLGFAYIFVMLNKSIQYSGHLFNIDDYLFVNIDCITHNKHS